MDWGFLMQGFGGGVSGKHEGAMDGSSFLEWDPKLKKKRASLLA